MKYCPYCGGFVYYTHEGWVCENCGMTEKRDEELSNRLADECLKQEVTMAKHGIVGLEEIEPLKGRSINVSGIDLIKEMKISEIIEKVNILIRIKNDEVNRR